MTGADFVQILDRALGELAKSRDELRDLDAAVGDGDLGLTITSAAEGVRKALLPLAREASPSLVLSAVGSAVLSANPSSFSALSATGILAAAKCVAGLEAVSRDDIVRMGHEAARAISARGKCVVGDKTFLDPLVASVEALEQSPDQPAFAVAITAARKAVKETSLLEAKRGRATWLGDRSRGHADPGAVAYVRLLESLQAAAGDE